VKSVWMGKTTRRSSRKAKAKAKASEVKLGPRPCKTGSKSQVSRMYLREHFGVLSGMFRELGTTNDWVPYPDNREYWAAYFAAPKKGTFKTAKAAKIVDLNGLVAPHEPTPPKGDAPQTEGISTNLGNPGAGYTGLTALLGAFRNLAEALGEPSQLEKAFSGSNANVAVRKAYGWAAKAIQALAIESAVGTATLVETATASIKEAMSDQPHWVSTLRAEISDLRESTDQFFRKQWASIQETTLIVRKFEGWMEATDVATASRSPRIGTPAIGHSPAASAPQSRSTSPTAWRRDRGPSRVLDSGLELAWSELEQRNARSDAAMRDVDSYTDLMARALTRSPEPGLSTRFRSSEPVSGTGRGNNNPRGGRRPAPRRPNPTARQGFSTLDKTYDGPW